MAWDDFLHPGRARASKQNRAREREVRGMYRDLIKEAPTAETLTADYEEEGALDELATDPEGLEAQRRALAGLEDIYSNRGFTADDRAEMAARQRAAAQGERGQREAIVRGAEERGVGGSGLESASQMMAQQGAAHRAADWEAQASAEGRTRALQALQSASGLGTSMRGQGDAIGQFNAQYMRDVNRRNVGTRNAEEDSRRQAEQQAWENRYRGTEGYSGNLRDRQASDRARAEARGTGTLGTLGTLGGGILGGPGGAAAGGELGGWLDDDEGY